LIRVNDNLKVEATKEEKPQLLLHIDYDFTRVNDQRKGNPTSGISVEINQDLEKKICISMAWQYHLSLSKYKNTKNVPNL
jgi:hypothetical protein